MKNFAPNYVKAGAIMLIVYAFISCAEKKQPVLPPPDIKVVDILQQDVPVFKEFVGQIYGEFDIPIRARVSGFLEGIHFDEGSRVVKGQLLYSIDKQPFEAQVAREMSKLAEAKTQYAKTQSDLNRIKPLAEINAVSMSDLDAAQAEYEAALAYVDAAEASVRLSKIQLSYCTMLSPINGVIGKTKAKVGEFVGQNPNPVILNTVSKIQRVRVEFFLSESDYLLLSRAYIDASLKQKIEQELKDEARDGQLELILADGSTFQHKGKVDFIDRNIDPTTGAILIQATFPNPENLLRPGLFARVRAKLFDATNAMLIPQRCVSEIQGKYSVYTVGSDNLVKYSSVEIGLAVGDMWIIKKGLKKDDIVVLEGIQQVREGVTINPVKVKFESKSEIINN